MATIKRHWKLMLLGFLGVGIVVMTGMLMTLRTSPLRAAETATPPPPPLDNVTYSHLAQIRDRACLRNEALAAMGCTQAEAEGVLDGLRSWYDSNRTQLGESEQAIAVAASNYQRALERFNVGPADTAVTASLKTLREAHAQMVKDRDAILATAITSLEARLTEQQKAIWKAIRTSGAIGDFQYISDITPAQVVRLQKLWQQRDLSLPSARSAQEQAAAQAAFDQGVGDVLIAGQIEQLQACRQRITSLLGGVKAAEARMLRRQ